MDLNRKSLGIQGGAVLEEKLRSPGLFYSHLLHASKQGGWFQSEKLRRAVRAFYSPPGSVENRQQILLLATLHLRIGQ